MNWNKKITQGIVLTVCMVALICAGVFFGAAETEAPAEITAANSNGKAGIIASLEETENSVLDLAQSASVTVEKAETETVAAASKSETEVATVASKSEAQSAAEKAAEESMSKTEQEWQDKVMADVEDSLSIRAKADADAEIVGKLYPTSVATVVKEGKTWTKIKSGSVKGYVKNEYLLFGSDAYNNAKKVCKKYAFVQTDGLRVRSEADEDATVLTTADKGDKLLYNSKAEKVEGWVAVKVKAGNGYVSADFVKVKLDITDAVSIEEEIAAQKAKEAAEAKAAAASSSSSSSGSSSSSSSSSATQNAPTSASVDDATLLAAIIQCEAGSECYEGKVAVGAVVLNRVRSGGYPNSISGVIYQSGQFSPVSNGSLARVLASGNISSSCRQAAADALAGSDPTGGKLSFHRADGSSGVVIGNHVFY